MLPFSLISQQFLMVNLGLCCRANDENALEADFGAFDFPIPNLKLPSSIGNGLHFVSKFLTSRFSGKLAKTQPILDYLLSLNHQGEVNTILTSFLIFLTQKCFGNW